MEASQKIWNLAGCMSLGWEEEGEGDGKGEEGGLPFLGERRMSVPL